LSSSYTQIDRKLIGRRGLKPKENKLGKVKLDAKEMAELIKKNVVEERDDKRDAFQIAGLGYGKYVQTACMEGRGHSPCVHDGIRIRAQTLQGTLQAGLSSLDGFTEAVPENTEREKRKLEEEPSAAEPSTDKPKDKERKEKKHKKEKKEKKQKKEKKKKKHKKDDSSSDSEG